MTKLKELENVFYDLILQKSVTLKFKNMQCYLELSNQGKELIVETALFQNKPGLIKQILKGLPYFKSQNVLIDSKNNQIIIIKKLDFANMSPDIFSLQMILLYSEVIKYRDEINSLDLSEKVLVPR